MNNTFEFPLLRFLNTLLLAAILATLVFISLHMRQPVRVLGPVDVEVTNEPSVEVTNHPLDVEIWR